MIIDIVEKQGLFEIVGLIDPAQLPGAHFFGYKILGSDQEISGLMRQGRVAGLLIAIGDNWTRAKVARSLAAVVRDLPLVTAIHPSAQIAKGVEIGLGSVIMAGAVVNSGACIKRLCIVNTNAALDHDSVLGDFASLGPGATVGGEAAIGAYTAVGIGAIVLNGVRIGEHCVIGAGATVLHAVPDAVVAFGTPARVVRQRIPEEGYL